MSELTEIMSRKKMFSRIVSATTHPKRATKTALRLANNWYTLGKKQRAMRRFATKTNALLTDFDQPESPEGIVLCADVANIDLSAKHLLLARHLAKHNWAVIPLQKRFSYPYLSNPTFAALQGCLVQYSATLYALKGDSLDQGLRGAWEIDMPNRICRCDGVD
jgi:hypothetical protein